MYVLVAVVALLALLTNASFHFVWWIDLIVAVVIVLTIASLAFVGALRIFGDRTILGFDRVKNLLRWEECKHCTAGSQWWDGKNWGPIPEHARRMTKGGRYIEAAQANVRKCSRCVGGGWWLPKIPPKVEIVTLDEPKPEPKPWWDTLGDEEET